VAKLFWRREYGQGQQPSWSSLPLRWYIQLNPGDSRGQFFYRSYTHKILKAFVIVIRLLYSVITRKEFVYIDYGWMLSTLNISPKLYWMKRLLFPYLYLYRANGEHGKLIIQLLHALSCSCSAQMFECWMLHREWETLIGQRIAFYRCRRALKNKKGFGNSAIVISNPKLWK